MATKHLYNKFYTPEKWEQVNPDNKNLLDEFLDARQFELSPRTIDGYRQDLRIFLVLVLERFGNASVLDMSKKDFRKLTGILANECEQSSNRVNRIKSAINSMLTYAEEDDEIDYDRAVSKQIKGLKRVPVKTDQGDFFISYDEIMQIREQLIADGDLRTAVYLMLSFDSAGRRNEIYQVQKHHLLDGNTTNVVIGKRGKKFPLIYLSDTRDLIAKYLEWRGEDDIDSLWIKKTSQGNAPVESSCLYDWAKKCSDVLSQIRGTECNIFPHTLRHSRLECLKEGQDERLKNPDGTNRRYTLDELQIFAHHESSSTTQGYLKDHSEEQIANMFNI